MLRDSRFEPKAPAAVPPVGTKGAAWTRRFTRGLQRFSGLADVAPRPCPIEVALETGVFTRVGVERIARLGFELARSRKGILVSCTKSNASPHAYVFWDEVVEEVAAELYVSRAQTYKLVAKAREAGLLGEELDR